MFTLHPTTLELKSLGKQIQSIKNSLIKSNLNMVFTCPNADPGYKRVIVYKNFKDRKKYVVFKNTGINLYINLLRNANYC